jgi:hypothetical protein
MRPDLPELTAAVRKGAVLTSEMEVFFEVCPCRIIAVTGSEGRPPPPQSLPGSWRRKGIQSTWGAISVRRC